MVYLPSHFEETDSTALNKLVREHPLGTLITVSNGTLVADHIPFLWDRVAAEHGTLVGHVARANDLWHAHDPEVEALVIFGGPTAYISPNWYETKMETHQVVPTYNYLVVHAYGRLVIHDDEKWVRGIVGRLTKAFEAEEPKPWKMADAPRDFITDQLSRIVGIEIPVSRVIGKWKASQNRPIADQRNVVSKLTERGRTEDPAIAATITDRLGRDDTV